MAEPVEPETGDEEAQDPLDDRRRLARDDGLEPTDAEPDAERAGCGWTASVRPRRPDRPARPGGVQAADRRRGCPGPALPPAGDGRDLRARWPRSADRPAGPDAADRVDPGPGRHDAPTRPATSTSSRASRPGRFGVLLPETDEVAAINYVERVRRACELWLESGAIALSLAVGWAGTTGDPTLVEAQRLATERMYVELRRDTRRATAEG